MMDPSDNCYVILSSSVWYRSLEIANQSDRQQQVRIKLQTKFAPFNLINTKDTREIRRKERLQHVLGAFRNHKRIL
jgi:predicted alpha/beta superfamily hydrolase